MITLRLRPTDTLTLDGAPRRPVTLIFDHFVYLGRGSRLAQILGPKLLVFLKFRALEFRLPDLRSYCHLWVAEAEATWLQSWKRTVFDLVGRWLTRHRSHTDGWRIHDVTHAGSGSRLRLRLRVWWDRWGLSCVEIERLEFDQPTIAEDVLREIAAASAEEETTK